VEAAPALLFGARRLLAQLRLWLQLRQRGVLALQLWWQLDDRRANAAYRDAHHPGGSQGQLLLHTAQATQDTQHLQRLLAEQLARVRLPAPVLQVGLRSVQTQPLVGQSLSLLPDAVHAGDSLAQLIERLGARLGPDQVQRVSPLPDYRPERMQHWHAAAEAALAATHAPALAAAPHPLAAEGTQADAALYPTWLLATPQRLALRADGPHYHGRLELLAGPQRLEVGWLDGDADCALRDYYVARSPCAGLLWVYRQRLRDPQVPAHWYLHGLFA
ncbi:MAG: DNA polymerase Y family protein, partial [Rhodoferax sp.]